ncbi:MAG: CAP domain-containing protein [Acidimicrobiia bacterium]|nr:CAP domain-containing protein [Acidimicrobiia bacterium]MDH4365724.1 CAP domain-containing protein [Acidimicrobiia bacterium]
MVPAVASVRPTPGPGRARLARVAALVLVASLAGAACGQSDDTASPGVDLAQVATGQGVDPLPADQTAGIDPAAVRADIGGTAAAPAGGLGGVAAAPPVAAPTTAAPAAPAPSSTARPAPVAAPAAAAPTTTAPAPATGGTAESASLPTVAVSGAASPAPTPTSAVAPPATAAESDLAAGEERSFTLLNELRGGLSLAALTRDPALDTLAREWSRHMAESGELVHSENPYGENIAFTSNTSLTAAEAAQVFERLWAEDPGHSQNMAGAYVKVGVGVWKSERGWYGTHLYNY